MRARWPWSCLALPLAASCAITAGEPAFEVHIDDWDGAGAYGHEYVITPRSITITLRSDLQGEKPKRVWSCNLNDAQKREIADILTRLPLDSLRERYVDAGVSDGLQMTFKIRRNADQAKEITVGNVLQMDLVALCRHVNGFLPGNRRLSYGREPSSIDDLAGRPVTKWSSSRSFGGYEPRVPRSMDDLPAGVRQKVEQHLIERLGRDFYGRLKLVGGQIIEREKLPAEMAGNPGVHDYDLVFLLALPEKGIAEYNAQLKLNRDGDVLEEIDLPDLVRHPEKRRILSLKEALLLARDAGVPLDRISVGAGIGYDRKRDCLSWRIGADCPIDTDDKTVKSRVFIDAHSGKVLEEAED